MTDGLRVVREMLDDWCALRAELRGIEEAENPPFTDRFGREWTWRKGDLWHHDDTLALPRFMVDAVPSLPPEKLRANPNYHKLCEICRSQWADKSPVSPRCRLGDQWFDVRDGQYYPEQEAR
jgi:hypothetical protein